MRNQSWLPDGTLVQDEEIWRDALGTWYKNNLTGEKRPATPQEAATLPDPEIEWATSILKTSPPSIPMPDAWRILRLFARLLGITS